MWEIKDIGFQKDEVIHHGNKFLIGNGYMGYRGTLEEFDKTQLVGINLPGVYDRFENKWRESINTPNPLFTRVIYEGQILDPTQITPSFHEQSLNLRHGIHSRKTEWKINDCLITIESERFVSMTQKTTLAMKYQVVSDCACDIVFQTGIDGDIWDINGPHIESYTITTGDTLTFTTHTRECHIPIVVREQVEGLSNYVYVEQDQKVLREKLIHLKKGEPFIIYKMASIEHSTISQDVVYLNYDVLLKEHQVAWENRWNLADVLIIGDDEAQLALRYSIYHLLILAPKTKNQSIPARGISGQTYKGAIFWDTEMFMLPFYLNTDLETAKILMTYRIHTLDGARRKAQEYGYRGAFYAWESQETGDDACSHFNVTDVFTQRPIRTYFRDKQIHISGDVAFAMYQTYLRTQDLHLLIDGGAEVILECARFFYSYSIFNDDKKRFELMDVTGPDEYHERVRNNAFTNRMVLETITIALKVINLLKKAAPDVYLSLMSSLDYNQDLKNIKRMKRLFYLPKPNEWGIIEQFDGYEQLEEIKIEDLKQRLVHPNEYWGGGNGIATPTKIIKQADVVTMLYVFKNDYSKAIKEANWSYYEPRTEHGSSLSACMYALVACENGNPDWAYPFFMKTATVDLTGNSKQYAGGIYIGGTHPAANGGAYMTAIYGFAGLNIENNQFLVQPRLPKSFKGMEFKFLFHDEIFKILIMGKQVTIVKE